MNPDIRAFVGDLLPERRRTRGFAIQSFFTLVIGAMPGPVSILK